MNFMRFAPIGLVMLAPTAQATDLIGSGTDYITTYSPANYGGYGGTIIFNDWNYTGPNGAGANDFYVPDSGGFNADNVGQIQNVITMDADGLTSDPAKRVLKDDSSGAYLNANMDTVVNFYKWAYTTVGGSTFDNMMIDKAGNYFVARDDMTFQYYDVFNYTNTVTGASEPYDTAINFQPYAVSDARGWCGSTMIENPNGLAVMAGQVGFDFAFDAYLAHRDPVPGQGGGTQIVPDFIMRSYGDYFVDFGNDPNATALANELQRYRGSAVINNTNPVTGDLDPDFQNRVSFLGAGVVPLGVWVTADSYDGDGIANTNRVLNDDSTWRVTVAGDGMDSLCDPAYDSLRAGDGAVCWRNSFAGYAFLMRADGSRELVYINPEGHSNYIATDPAAYESIGQVPVPAAAWLLGSGLVGLVAAGRRRKG